MKFGNFLESKSLNVDDKITFFLSSETVVDGIIIEKVFLDKGDISFLIRIDNGKFIRMKHRNLDLYCKY